MPARRVGVLLVLCAAMALSPGGADAQTAEEDSVANRARPDFDAIGIELDELLGTVGLVSDKTIEQKSSPLSSFVVFPSFGISAVYDSNVFLTNENTVSDRRVVYSPSVSIASDWANHALSFTAAADIGRYQDVESENYEDFQLQAAGRIDVHDDLFVTGVTGFARRHQSRGEEDDPGQGFDPTVSDNWFADSTAEYFADAILARLKFRYEFQDYMDASGIDNDVKDVSLYNYSLRLGYEFTPGTTVFVQPQGDMRRFVQKRDAGGLLQDNQAAGALVCITLDSSGVTFLEFGAGLSHRTYDEPTFQAQTNVDFSGKFVWNPTDLLTFQGDVGRNTAESSTPGESGVLATTYSIKLDYEFLDNIILSAGLSPIRGENQELDRTDLDYAANLGVRYLVNENWSANMTLVRARRSSNIDTENYESLVATVGLVGKL